MAVFIYRITLESFYYVTNMSQFYQFLAISECVLCLGQFREILQLNQQIQYYFTYYLSHLITRGDESSPKRLRLSFLA